MTRVPSEEQLRKEIRETLKLSPHMMRCITCSHYGKITSFCDVYQRTTFPHVPGCNSYESNEEMMLREVIADLTEQERIINAAELMCNIMPTTANAATLMGEHLLSLVKAVISKEKDASVERKLKKDAALTREMTDGCKRMVKAMDSIKDKWYKALNAFMEDVEKDFDSMDAQYRQYIQIHIDKCFKKSGAYDAEKDAQFLSNAGEFCLAILDNVKRCYEKDGEECPLNDKDFKRYKIKK
jgi:hypothetical protein